MGPSPNNNQDIQQGAPQVFSQADSHVFSSAPNNNDQPASFMNSASSVDQPTLDIPPTSDLPVPVVQVLSVRGVEYTMMTFALWIIAGALIWSGLSIANGLNSFEILSFPVSLLIVCVPVFGFLFLRLRKAELQNPVLRMDASKRRLSQFTQIIAFAACLFNLIGFVYVVLSKIGGSGFISIPKALLNLSVVLVVAGGVLAYYWFDEHRAVK